jgi:hypothetical protein
MRASCLPGFEGPGGLTGPLPISILIPGSPYPLGSGEIDEAAFLGRRGVALRFVPFRFKSSDAGGDDVLQFLETGALRKRAALVASAGSSTENRLAGSG